MPKKPIETRTVKQQREDHERKTAKKAKEVQPASATVTKPEPVLVAVVPSGDLTHLTTSRRFYDLRIVAHGDGYLVLCTFGALGTTTPRTGYYTKDNRWAGAVPDLTQVTMTRKQADLVIQYQTVKLAGLGYHADTTAAAAPVTKPTHPANIMASADPAMPVAARTTPDMFKITTTDLEKKDGKK